MKKLMIGLVSLLFAGMAMAGTIIVQATDEVIGYDGDCQVYFRPDLGFYEVCPSMEPVFIGVTFEQVHFRHGFHFREGFTRERINSMTHNTNINSNTNVNRNTNVNSNVNRNVDVNARRSENMHGNVNSNANANVNVNRNANMNRNSARSMDTPGPLRHEAQSRPRQEPHARSQGQPKQATQKPGQF